MTITIELPDEAARLARLPERKRITLATSVL